MKTQQHNIRIPFRNTALGIIIAASVVATLPAHAGWFSNVGSKVQNTAAKVAATPGNVEAKVKDISAKLNEIFAEIQENHPLRENLRNGHMMTTLKETLTYISDMQADYEQFANSGVNFIRADMKGMLTNFGQISQTFGRNAAIAERLDKVGAVMDKIPTVFLYAMQQAVGAQLEDMQERIAQLQQQLAHLPMLPPINQVRAAPMSHTAEICPLVNDKPTKVTVAVIKTTLKSISFILTSIKSYLPDDLVVTANVVAGGGLTMSKNPAQLPFQIALTVVDSLSLILEDYETIATAACPDAK